MPSMSPNSPEDDTTAPDTSQDGPSPDQSSTNGGAQPPVAASGLTQVPSPEADAPPPPVKQPSDMTNAEVLKAVPAQKDSFYDPMRDPAFLRNAAMTAFATHSTDGLKYLAAMHEAYQENGIDGSRALLRGDTDGAIKLFNQSGQVRDLQSLSANPADKDGNVTYTWKRADGSTGVIDPKASLMSMMSPAQYADYVQKGPLVAGQTQEALSRAAMYEGANPTKLAVVQGQIEGARQRGAEAATTAAAARVYDAETKAKSAESKYGIGATLQNTASAYNKGIENGAPPQKATDGSTLTGDEVALKSLPYHADFKGFVPDHSDPNTIVAVNRAGDVVARVGSPANFQRIYGVPYKPPAAAAPAPGDTTKPAPGNVPYVHTPARNQGATGMTVPAAPQPGATPDATPAAAAPATASPTASGITVRPWERSSDVIARNVAAVQDSPSFKQLGTLIAQEGAKPNPNVAQIQAWQNAKKAMLDQASTGQQ